MRAGLSPAEARRQARLDFGCAELHKDAAREARGLDPLGYPEMLDLVGGAFAVVTDSGGLQEETTALGVRCLTARENTERPVTIAEGTNRLIGDLAGLPALVRQTCRRERMPRPEGWDGRAGERVVQALVQRRRAVSPA